MIVLRIPLKPAEFRRLCSAQGKLGMLNYTVKDVILKMADRVVAKGGK